MGGYATTLAVYLPRRRQVLASCVGREVPWAPGAAIFSAADVPQVPGSIQVLVHQVPLSDKNELPSYGNDR